MEGKLFVLVLLGFVVTDFVITMTLSAADATAHIVENPFTPAFLHHRVMLTLILLTVLGAIFLKGFKEAIGIAVWLVAAYILLNLVVVTVGLREVFAHPEVIPSWKNALLAHPQVLGSPWLAIGVAPHSLPETRPWSLWIRDWCGGDAAGEGRRR
jgi:hypothetical protein